MAEEWTFEEDGRTFVLGLREGLKFHDGEPVRSADCIASIQRWGARDGFGQLMMRFVDGFEAVDDRKFRIKLKKPFPLLPAALGKSNSSQCFIMPERMAKVDPMKQVTETIGSGPYRFLKEEFVSGAKAAWAKFDGYIPRKEPVDSIAGGRIPAVNRIEWSFISDSSTAMAALLAGEQDYWDAPSLDLVPVMKADPKVVVSPRNPTGSYYMLQLNHTQPPFNNPKVRQALAMAIDQTDFLKSAVSDPALLKPCYSYYGSDLRYASEQGAEVLKTKSLEKAKAALKESGYAGEKVVILGVMESPTLAAMSQMAEDLMRRTPRNERAARRDGFRHHGATAHQQGADGQGRLEPVRHSLDRLGHRQSRCPPDVARRRRDRMVRLAETIPRWRRLRDRWANAPTPEASRKSSPSRSRCRPSRPCPTSRSARWWHWSPT